MSLNNLDESLLQHIYERLDEQTPLKPDTPLYDELYEAVYSLPDCDDPVIRLRKHIRWTREESLQLFSGFRGSGKTTELFRLKKQLEDDGYLVLYVDALEYISPSEELDVTNLLITFAAAFGEAMSAQLQTKPPGESFTQRIIKLLDRISIPEAKVKVEMDSPLKEVLGGLKGGIELKAALKDSPGFRQKVEKLLENRVSELKDQVNQFVESSVKALQAKFGVEKRVVFLFDSLEQIRGSRSNEQSVIHSIERLFAAYYPKMWTLPYVHAIFTVPPWLKFSNPNVQRNIVIIPSVRQWNNDDERSECRTGCDALYSFVKRRFGTEGFRRCFGGDQQVQHPLARKLIDNCGGHFRDLLLLLRETLLGADSLPFSDEVIESAIAEVRRQFLPIAIDDAHWLHQIALSRDSNLKSSNHPDVSRLTRFLDTHFVLYFKNHDDWYDVHPLIRHEVAEIVQHSPQPASAIRTQDTQNSLA